MKNKLLFLLLTLLVIPSISISAEMRAVDIEFSYSVPDHLAKQLVGYKLYKENVEVCATKDPSSSKISCQFPSETGSFNFSLKAYYTNGTESPPSPSFAYTIAAVTETPALSPTSATAPIAVVSSSTAAGNAPLNVSFNGTSSTTGNASIVSYNWTFGDGTQATGQTTSHTFTTPGTYSATLTVVDNKGLSGTINTPIIVAGTASANKTPTAATTSADQNQEATASTTKAIDGKAAPTDKNFNVEIGTVSIDQEWVKVLFKNSFSEPIVVASPPTVNETQPALVRIRNIDKEGFEIRIQEWDHLDGSHAPETVSYVVLEKGIYTLDNGIKVEAGSFTGTTSFQQVTLKQTYNDTPVILTQVVTDKETDALTNRVQNIDQISFSHKVQQQDSTPNTHPEAETVGYIAWEPGQGEVYGLLFEAGITARSVNQDWFNLTFQTAFPDLPFFFAGMQTTYDNDTAALRTQKMTQSGTQIKIEENQSSATRTRRSSEVLGYFTIGSAVKK